MTYALLFALALVALGATVLVRYRHTHDTHYLLYSATLVTMGAIFTYATKILLVYKPLLVLHLALLILCWAAIVKYISRRILLWPLLLAPALSLLLFVAVALFFREH